MSPLSVARPRAIAALTAAATVGAIALAAAPARASARAAEPPKLTPKVEKAIAHDHLKTEVSHGWEAVTGTASKVNDVRIDAVESKIGTVVAYTGDDETGQAILIFTGYDKDVTPFEITGTAIRSVDNDTDQSWYLYDDKGKKDAEVSPDTAKNIPAVDASLVNVNLTRFSVQPWGTVFSF